MSTLFDNLDLFVSGFRTTLVLFLVSGLAALVLGTIIGAMRVSPVPPMRAFGTVYVNTVRNTPLTLLMFFFAFGYPKLGLADVGYTTLAIFALSLYTATYVAEALRSGINTVPVGQAEAARSIGLGFTQTVRLVVLPQAIRSVIPPLVNVIIALTKNTSVASGFFVFTLVSAGQRLASANGDQVIAVLVGVAVFYVIITIPLGRFADWFEKRVAVTR